MVEAQVKDSVRTLMQCLIHSLLVNGFINNVISPYYYKTTVYFYRDQSVMWCLHRNYLKALYSVKW